MKVYVTKHALTRGILKLEVRQSKLTPSMVCCSEDPNWSDYYHGEGINWHRTLEAAKARAENMRQKKLIALENALNKLKKLKF